MKTFVTLLLVALAGWFLYNGPLLPFRVKAEFTPERLKAYEKFTKDYQEEVGEGSNFSLKGKVAVVYLDFQTKTLHPATFKLPKEIRADHPDEVDTLVHVTRIKKTFQDKYGNNTRIITMAVPFVNVFRLPGGHFIGQKRVIVKEGETESKAIARLVNSWPVKKLKKKKK